MRRYLPIFFAAMAWALPLQAATQAVYDVPTRPGVFNRILVVTPPAPVATVLLFAGGNGALLLGPDGSVNALNGNFLIRSQNLFVDQGFTTVLVDAPSDRVNSVGLASFRQTPEHAADIAAVIAFVGQLRAEPLWLIGTSNGTLSVGFLSFTLPPSTRFGVVLTSSILASDAGTRDLLEMPLDGNHRTTLVVHNQLDQCPSCPPASVPTLMQHLSGAPLKDFMMFNGGDTPIADFCEGKAYHGFFGIESQVVAAIGAWAIAHPPAIDLNLPVPQGWNLLGNSLNQTLSVATLFNDPSLVHSVWKWDSTNAKWQFHTPLMDSATLQNYAAGKGYGVLSTINPGEGYWVYALTSMNLPSQTGTPFNWNSFSFASLTSGFNLIAHAGNVTPSQFNANISATPPAAGVVATTNFASLWAWDATNVTWYFYSPLLESTAGLTAVKSYADSHFFEHFQDFNKKIDAGIGFWVNKF